MAAGPRELLRRRPFRRLYATRLVGQLTDGVLEASLAGFVLFSPERATTAPRIAAAAAVVLLPYSVVGPAAGVVIDRADRRRVLLVANLLRAGVVMALAAVVGAGYAGAGFYALALLAFSINRFVLSALSAATPATVDADDLVGANALSTTSGTAATIVGLGAGSVLASVVGGSAVVAVAASALYVGAAVVAAGFPVGLLRPAGAARGGALRDAGRALADVADGARHLWRRPVARGALLSLAAHRFFFGISTVATVLLFRNLFAGRSGLVPGGAGGLALVVVAAGAGTLLGAVLTPWATQWLRPSTWFVALLVGAAVVGVGLGLPYRPELLVVASLLLGVVSQGSKICVDSLVQRSVDDGYRGRAFAFYDQLFNVAYVAAAGASALLLPTDGRSPRVVVLVAAGYLLVAAGYRWASSRAGAAAGALSPDRPSGTSSARSGGRISPGPAADGAEAARRT